MMQVGGKKNILSNLLVILKKRLFSAMLRLYNVDAQYMGHRLNLWE